MHGAIATPNCTTTTTISTPNSTTTISTTTITTATSTAQQAQTRATFEKHKPNPSNNHSTSTPNPPSEFLCVLLYSRIYAHRSSQGERGGRPAPEITSRTSWITILIAAVSQQLYCKWKDIATARSQGISGGWGVELRGVDEKTCTFLSCVTSTLRIIEATNTNATFRIFASTG